MQPLNNQGLMNKPFPSSLVPLFQNASKCENDFDLHENDSVSGTCFHMNGFALRLVLTQTVKGNSEMAYCEKWTDQHHTRVGRRKNI